ncbi:MAG: hypothetical protein ABIJ91_03005 [Candidatus Kuenenbacteria bacterium]
MNYTILIKQHAGQFVALCLELNVSAQGDTMLKARQELGKAIKEYKDFSNQEKIFSAPLDVETVRDFLLSRDQEDKQIKLDDKFNFLETFTTTLPAYADPVAV